MPPISKECLVCGTNFEVILARAKTAKYCSIGCRAKDATKLITTKCLICGKEINLPPATRNRGEGKYCSLKCYFIERSRAGRVTVQCEHCGKSFIKKRSEEKRFCTKKCYYSDQRKKNDLTGKKIGMLTVLKFSHTTSHGTYWKCRCDCGNIKIARQYELKSGKTQRCGEHRVRNLKGQKFHRLTVIRRTGSDIRGKALWLCRCDCGNELEILGASLISDNTKSCGCLKKRNLDGGFKW